MCKRLDLPDIIIDFRALMPNTALEPTPITPGSYRFGFPVGESHLRRGSAFGR